MLFSLRRSVNKISWDIGCDSFPLSSPKKEGHMRPVGLALGIYDVRLDREGTSWELWSQKGLSFDLSAFFPNWLPNFILPLWICSIFSALRELEKFSPGAFKAYLFAIDKVWFLKSEICDPVLPPQEYEAPAIDDGKLEVVAIFGSVQMAMSRIINLHHHRIAQVGTGQVGTR